MYVNFQTFFPAKLCYHNLEHVHIKPQFYSNENNFFVLFIGHTKESSVLLLPKIEHLLVIGKSLMAENPIDTPNGIKKVLIK